MPRERRKKNKGGEGEEGGGHGATGSMRWLLTYADIITLLLGVFIILASVSQVTEEKYREIAQAFQRMFTFFDKPPQMTPLPAQPSGSVGILRAGSARAPVKLKAHFLNAFQKEISIGKVQVEEVRGNIVVRFQDMVFFDLGSAQLRPEAMDVLDRLAVILESIDNEVIIEGHTDATPISTPQFPSNWELSLYRAATVIRYLQDHAKAAGFDGEKLLNYCKRLSGAGYAHNRPIISDNLYDPRNRRIDVVVLSPQKKEKDILF